MKLSFAVSLQNTCFAYIASKTGWHKKLKLLSVLGYEGVELGIRDPSRIRIDSLRSALDEASLELSAIGTGQAYVDEGLSLSSFDSVIRKKAVERMKQHIDLASCFNTQVIIGLIRGRKNVAEGSNRQYEQNLLNSTRCICDYASKKKIVVAVEPLNRYETDFLNNAEQALYFIKKIKYSNLKILLDTFHMNIEEKDLITPIKKCGEHLYHFHFADNNRRCPGDGSIDFRKIISQLESSSFKGYVSGEMLPVPTVEYCMKKFVNVVRSYLRRG